MIFDNRSTSSGLAIFTSIDLISTFTGKGEVANRSLNSRIRASPAETFSPGSTDNAQRDSLSTGDRAGASAFTASTTFSNSPSRAIGRIKRPRIQLYSDREYV